MKLLIFLCLVAAGNIHGVHSTATKKPATTSIDTTSTTAPGSETTTTKLTSTTAPGSETIPTKLTTDTGTGTSSTQQMEPTSATVPDPCDPNPCGCGATCTPGLENDYVCICMTGDVYNKTSNQCIRAKVFPGNLILPEPPFDKEMTDQSSDIFKKTAKEITDKLDNAFFGNTDYRTSIVLSLSQIIVESPLPIRNANEGVNASVQTLFDESSNVDSNMVKKTIENKLSGANFTVRPLCELKLCDEASTDCTEPADGLFECICKPGYLITALTDKVCLACPNGQQLNTESFECEACPFGKSGFNCEDDLVLVLVILVSVFGGLLVISLIVFSVVACKSKKRAKKTTTPDFGKPYLSHSAAKSPRLDDSGRSSLADVPMNTHEIFTNGVIKIPRATPSASWDSRNRQETTPGKGRQNVANVRQNSHFNNDMDEVNGSPYRRGGNPYAQSRPQRNPYAQSNPSYVHDDGRRNY